MTRRPHPQNKENSDMVIGDPEGMERDVQEKISEKVVGNKTSLYFSVFL